MHPSSWSLALALACGMWSSAGLAATVYSWTDERGVVNYGSEPPAPSPGHAVRRIEIREPVVDADSADVRDARRAREATALAALEAARHARLEDDLLAERAKTEKARQALLFAQADATRERDALEASDCGDSGACTYPVAIIYPRGYHPRPRPLLHSSSQAPTSVQHLRSGLLAPGVR